MGLTAEQWRLILNNAPGEMPGARSKRKSKDELRAEQYQKERTRDAFHWADEPEPSYARAYQSLTRQEEAANADSWMQQAMASAREAARTSANSSATAFPTQRSRC